MFNSGIRSASGKIPFLVLYIYTPTNWKRDGEILLGYIKYGRRRIWSLPLSCLSLPPTRSASSIPNATHERYQRAWKLPVRSGASRRLAWWIHLSSGLKQNKKKRSASREFDKKKFVKHFLHVRIWKKKVKIDVEKNGGNDFQQFWRIYYTLYIISSNLKWQLLIRLSASSDYIMRSAALNSWQRVTS